MDCSAAGWFHPNVADVDDVKYPRMSQVFFYGKRGRGGGYVRCVQLADCEGKKGKEKKNRQEGDESMSVRTMPVDNKKCDSVSRRLKPGCVRNTFCVLFLISKFIVASVAFAFPHACVSVRHHSIVFIHGDLCGT